MSAARVYLQPSFILQHRPYRETSVILDVLTLNHGLVSVLAKGVRKEKSKLAGLLLPFTRLNISFQDRHDLKLMTDVDYVEHYDLQKISLYCGFYVNELVQRFMHKQDPNTGLFTLYEQCLRQLFTCESDQVEEVLRYFEIDLLSEVGYGVDFEEVLAQDHWDKENCRFSYLPNTGIVKESGGILSFNTIQKLAQRESLGKTELAEAKQFMRMVIHTHLQGRPLKSRQVLATLLNYV